MGLWVLSLISLAFGANTNPTIHELQARLAELELLSKSKPLLRVPPHCDCTFDPTAKAETLAVFGVKLAKIPNYTCSEKDLDAMGLTTSAKEATSYAAFVERYGQATVGSNESEQAAIDRKREKQMKSFIREKSQETCTKIAQIYVAEGAQGDLLSKDCLKKVYWCEPAREVLNLARIKAQMKELEERLKSLGGTGKSSDSHSVTNQEERNEGSVVSPPAGAPEVPSNPSGQL